jgi:hypothetical protein
MQLEGNGAMARLHATRDHSRVQVTFFALAQQSAGCQVLTNDQGKPLVACNPDPVRNHRLDDRPEALARDQVHIHVLLAEQQWRDTTDKIKMQQPLDPSCHHPRQRRASRTITHETVGVDIDPGIAEDAAECLCWIHLDALHYQAQVVGAQLPELPEERSQSGRSSGRGRQIDG